MDSGIPNNWELLSASDQRIYEHISRALAAPTTRDRRHKRLDDFKEVLDAIELFENIDVADRWKRCLVCGIFTFRGGIAVSTAQLKSLMLKCKSSINGSLRRLGYTAIANKDRSQEAMLAAIPYLKGCPAELRRWTVRYHTGGRSD